MTQEIGIARAWVAYVVSVLAAIFIGFLLATPLALSSIALVGLLLLGLSFPLLMQWHHFVALITCNASFIVFFIPGQPSLGVVAATASLALAMLSRTLKKQSDWIYHRSLAWPLYLLAIVVAVTIAFTGGVGGRVFGTETWGGKRYLGVAGGIIIFFALTARRIPAERAKLYAYLFFLSGVTALGSDLAYAAGPGFYFLFVLFPSELAYLQASTQMTLLRLTGVAWTALACIYFMLLRHGLRGILDLTRPWRGFIFTSLLAVGLFGGYRSTVIITFMLIVAVFYFEGLLRSRYFPFLLALGIVVSVLTVAFVDQLPLSIQRSLSFLPLDVHPMARQDAITTLDWRLDMWKTVVRDVPKYFFLGKGYSFSGTDYELTQMAMRRGIFTSYEDTLISGNYHQGLLTLIIPFGIFGVIALVWFCWSSLKILHYHYRHGSPALHKINTFLLAYFYTRLVFYFVLYGQFDLDLVIFTSTVGLSLSLNGLPEKRPPHVSQPADAVAMAEAA
jgi:hypothetical protein